jgi:uncharacterized protein (TIGR00255 family)
LKQKIKPISINVDVIRSMTGFGTASLETEKFSIKVEIRSLNGKFLDLSLRIPKYLYNDELKFRNVISPALIRGTISVNISIQEKENPTTNEINPILFKAYYAQLRQLSKELDAEHSDFFSKILNIPDVIGIQEKDVDPEILEKVYIVLNDAFQNFDDFRKVEGGSLAVLLEQYTIEIEQLIAEISPFEDDRIQRLKERIFKHISQIQDVDLDQNRFEQEMIYYLEKLDISEEKTRLKQHCQYFLETINNEPKGKKLGFICQEMGREINTIGSKANQSDIQKIVVEMKDILEKMKEQILNVL